MNENKSQAIIHVRQQSGNENVTICLMFRFSARYELGK